MRLLGLAACVTLLAAPACGNPSGNGSGCESTGANVTINAQDNDQFDKPSVTISASQKVCWQNPGSVSHTVTADGSTPSDTSWHIDAQLNPDLVVLQSFGKQGVNYFYRCRLHGETGVVQVR